MKKTNTAITFPNTLGCQILPPVSEQTDRRKKSSLREVKAEKKVQCNDLKKSYLKLSENSQFNIGHKRPFNTMAGIKNDFD